MGQSRLEMVPDHNNFRDRATTVSERQPLLRRMTSRDPQEHPRAATPLELLLRSLLRRCRRTGRI